jgi:PST family polysaccharide transporter
MARHRIADQPRELALRGFGAGTVTPGSLARSAAAGAKWSVASFAWRHLLTAITSLVLARLVKPADFGLLAMAAVFTRFIDLVRDMGTGAGIIQARDAEDPLLSSVFWANAGLGAASSVLLFEAAPFAAELFREPRLAPVLRVLSVAPSIAAPTVVHSNLLMRRLQWQRLATVEFFGVLAGGVTGITLAWRGYGVWSLVWQSLGNVVVVSAGLWLATAWRPSFLFDTTAMRSVAGFSVNLTGFYVLNYFVRYADNLLIGRYLGARDLGWYDLAYRMMLLPLQYVATAFGRAVFPIYARIQEDRLRLGRAYLKVLGAVALLAFPMMFGLAVISRPLVIVALGTAWLPVASLLIVFGPLGALQAITTSAAGVYQAVGRTDLLFRWTAIAGVLTVGGFVAGLRFGILGVASAYALVSCVLAWPLLRVPLDLVDLSVADVLGVIRAPLMAALTMTVGVLATRLLLPGASISILGMSMLVGAGLYCVAIWLLGRTNLLELFELLRRG